MHRSDRAIIWVDLDGATTAEVVRLRRDTGGLDGQRTRKEAVYGIISLPADLASPAHLNHYERQHWCVEKRLH